MQQSIWLGLVVVHLSCLGCAGQGSRSVGAVAAPSPSSETLLTPIDNTYDPCVDFAHYACGTGKEPLGILQRNSGIMVWDKAPAVRDFLDRLVSGTYDDGKRSTGVLREFHARCTDAKARDLGLPEVRGQLDEVSRLETLPELARMLGGLHRRGIVRALVELDRHWEAIAPDEPYVARVALANPTLRRKAYADDAALLAQHLTHWRTLAKLIGGITPSEIEGARRIDRWLASANEPDLAQPALTVEPLISKSRLERAAFPWRSYFSGLGLSSAAVVRAAGPDTLDNIDALAQLSFADLRSSIKLTIAERWAEFIGLPIFEEEIRFHREVVDNQEHEAFELHQACADLASRALNPWLDEAFLASLPVPAEQPARELFQLLRDRFARTVAAATWLDDSSREAAAAKVRRTVLRFVADPIPGLDDVVLPSGSFVDAELRTRAHMGQRYLANIGSVAERKLYITNGDNAMYSSLVNQIRLSPEFARFPWVQGRPFNPINFGSLGTLMGHEISHALTITGRRFDDAGVRRETWPKAAVSTFESHSACLENQLRSFDAGAKWKIDAHRTLDEDIAELVGIQIALTTMEADGSTVNFESRNRGRREFFLAYAQQWCGFYRERADEDATDDAHSPLARTFSGILANVPEFAETFGCAAGTRMAPRNRCVIW